MPTKYYQKELPESAVYVKGAPLKFDLLQTQDPSLIEELDRCVSRGVGGVISITEAQYQEELKKKELESSSRHSSNQPRGRQELSAPSARHVAEAIDRTKSLVNGGMFAGPQRDKNSSPVSGRPMPEPILVPSPNEFSGIFTKPPPTAKASEIESASKG